MSSVVTVGEAMLELRPDGDGYAAAVAGDAFNTAARLAMKGHAVRHVQDLGEDVLAGRIRDESERRGLQIIGRTHRGRSNGMYLVSAGADGERRFQYHRAGSAAGETLLGLADAGELADADLLYVTGVTLAISADRPLLVERLRRAPGRLAIGLNLREGLHTRAPDGALHPVRPAQIVATLKTLMPGAELVFGSAEELAQLGAGEPAEQVAADLAADGRIVVMTDGARGAWAWHEGEVFAAQPARTATAVDTAGAGDALAAAFLDAQLAAQPVGTCLRAGVDAGRDAVLHPGALPVLIAA